MDIHSLTGASGGDSLTHWRVRGRVFFLLRARRGNSLTHWRVRGCVWLEQRARFFFAPCAAGEIHSLTGASGGWRVCGCVWLKKRGRFFFAPCAARGNSLIHWRIRGRVFFLVLCAAGEIHSLTGASTAVCGFFLLFARRGKFTHSLARPGALCFCLLCARRWTFTHSLARPGVIHSPTGASGGAFFFCSVRGGGNSLTHWRGRGCVWLEQRARFFFCSVRGGPSKKKNTGRVFFLFGTRRAEQKKNFFLERAEQKKKHIFRIYIYIYIYIFIYLFIYLFIY